MITLYSHYIRPPFLIYNYIYKKLRQTCSFTLALLLLNLKCILLQKENNERLSAKFVSFCSIVYYDMYFFFTHKPCFSASCWVQSALVSTALCYYIFSIHMIVRRFCCQSVFSWLLSHSVWQRVKHFSFTCLLLIIFCLFDCFFNWSDCLSMFYSLDHLLDTPKIIVCAAHTKTTGHTCYMCMLIF